MIVLVIIASILLLPCLTCVIYWSVVWSRVRIALEHQRSVRAGLKLLSDDDEAPRVSIIIPAHNEERIIEQCVRSLRNQNHKNLEFIFVLDRCTDGTTEVVRRHAAEDDRIVVIENDSCPDDWAGKCNAARLGADQATGQWLLFTDADTIFDPDLAGASVALAVDRNASMLTILSTLTSKLPHERVAQPVACYQLIQMCPIDRVRGNQAPRPFANGQFMLFSAEWYRRIGGHEAVRDDLLEDLAFARAIAEHDGKTEVLIADNMLRCSMYDSMESFAEGWKRIFMDAGRRRPRRLRKNGWRIMVIGVGLPIMQLVAACVGAGLIMAGVTAFGVIVIGLVLLGLLTQVSTLRLIYPLTGTPASAMIHFPRGSFIVGRILLRAARDLEKRRPISWGGRQYIPEPR